MWEWSPIINRASDYVCFISVPRSPSPSTQSLSRHSLLLPVTPLSCKLLYPAAGLISPPLPSTSTTPHNPQPLTPEREKKPWSWHVPFPVCNLLLLFPPFSWSLSLSFQLSCISCSFQFLLFSLHYSFPVPQISCYFSLSVLKYINFANYAQSLFCTF